MFDKPAIFDILISSWVHDLYNLNVMVVTFMILGYDFLPAISRLDAGDEHFTSSFHPGNVLDAALLTELLMRSV